MKDVFAGSDIQLGKSHATCPAEANYDRPRELETRQENTAGMRRPAEFHTKVFQSEASSRRDST